MDGKKYCSRSLVDIIKPNNKILLSTFPEEIIENVEYVKKDSVFSTLKLNRKTHAIKTINYYFNDKLKLTITCSIDSLTSFFSISFRSKRFDLKEIIFLNEKADINFIGMKCYNQNKKVPKLFFLASFDKYNQIFSFSFDGLNLNTQPPNYIRCL